MSCRTVKIENQSDYESTIKGNLVEMLKAIKQHGLSFQVTKWSVLTIIDVIKAFVNMKIDYLK